MEHYTYAHYRNDTNDVFYIGKGKGIRAWRKADRSLHWKRIVKKHGYRVEILCKWETAQEAFDHETLLISCMRDLGKELVNTTDGGDAPPNWLGKKQSAEHIANRIASRKANGTYKQTEESIKKISSSLKGKLPSEEHKIKNSVAVKQWWDKRKGII